VLAGEEVPTQVFFLSELQAVMATKTGFGLFSGDEQRGEICLGVTDMTTFLRKGKQLLTAKTQLVGGGALGKFLTDFSHNLDTKAYGRRLESLELAQVASGLAPSTEVVLTKADGYQFVAGMDYKGTAMPSYIKKVGLLSDVGVDEGDFTAFDEVVVGRTYGLYKSGAISQPQVRVLEKSKAGVRVLIMKA